MPLERDSGWGRLAKSNQQLAYAMVTTVASLWLGAQSGVFQTRPLPVSPLIDVDARTKLLLAAETIQETNRMLHDLHTGIAPRDANQTPQFSAMRTTLDRQAALLSELTAVLKRNADATYRLTMAIEEDEAECLRPMTPSVRSRPGPQEATDTSLWRRFLGWMGRDVGS